MSIYYLDVDEEITGAVARLRASSDYHVVFVLPPDSRVATSRINFRLLAREAHNGQRRLAIVSAEPSIRAVAVAAELPAYPTVAAYEQALDQESLAPGLAWVGIDAPARTEGGLRGTRGRITREGAPDSVSDWTPEPTVIMRPGGVGQAEGAAGAAAGAEALSAAAAGGSGAAGAPPGGAAGTGGGAAGTGGGAAGTGVVGYRGSPPTPALADRPVKPASRVGGRSAGALPVVGPGRREAGKRRSRRRWVALLVVLVLLGAGGAYAGSIYLPSAEIILTPVSQPAGPVSLTITADPGVSKVDSANLVVPAQSVGFQLQAQGAFDATGVKVTETTATGTVRFFSNNPLDPVTIAVSTTVGTSGGVQFQTTATVVVPKATISGTTITAGRVDSDIEAVNPGLAGNVGAHSIKVVPQRYANLLVSCDNAAATSGGTHTETKTVTQQDYDAAVKSLNAQLDTQVPKSAADPSIAPPGTTVFAETAKRGTASFAPAASTIVGDAVPTFSLAATAAGSVVAVDETQLTPLAVAGLQAQVPSGWQLFADSVSVSVGDATVDGQRVSFPVHVVGERWQPTSAAQLFLEVKGKPIAEARTILSKYGDVTIKPWPDFVTTIPTLDSRVTITVNPPRRSTP